MAWRRGTLAIVVVLLLASCNSNKQEANPTTTTTTPPPRITTTTSAGPPTTAPPVTDPLDASTFEADPCTSLTDEQKQTFGIDRTRPIDITKDGEECFFHPGDREPIWVMFATNTTIGLSAEYQSHASGFRTYWEPTEVDGYPAVAYGNDDNLDCNFAIGITDSLYFEASADVNPGEERCATAKSVAVAILATIKTTQ